MSRNVFDLRDFNFSKYELLCLTQAVGGGGITYALRVHTWKITTTVLSRRLVSGGVQRNAARFVSADRLIITGRGNCKWTIEARDIYEISWVDGIKHKFHKY